MFLLVEYCPKGSLLDFLAREKRIGVDLQRFFTAQIVQSLEYLRSMEVVHRDLKPGNIVLDTNCHLKLIDFATCKVFNPTIKQKIETLRQRVNFGKAMGLEDDTDLLTNNNS